MANTKKYRAKLMKAEKMRKRRLAKKLKREKKLFGRKKDATAKQKKQQETDAQ